METVVLHLPEKTARNVRGLARRMNRPLEDVLIEWIDRSVSEIPVEQLPDEQVLALCDLYIPPTQQQRLSALLEQNREGSLGDFERAQLDDLMRQYRHGLIRKSQAVKIAVERGLRPALNAV